ncbi:MAG: hypothetical protein NTV49_04010, partial [Kiritimatiellaeota bacterium]|nr:hypothetical protein [Kiritimatiellota bacterium]
NLAIFIHFTDAAGRIVFQGDYGLADLLHDHALQLAAPRSFYKALPIPHGVAPGVYTLRVGVCRLNTADRLRIRASPLPQQTGAVLLAQPLRVTE